MTSIILTWRVVARTLTRAWRARLNTPDEDLATADGLEPIALEAHAAASDRVWLP